MSSALQITQTDLLVFLFFELRSGGFESGFQPSRVWNFVSFIVVLASVSGHAGFSIRRRLHPRSRPQRILSPFHAALDFAFVVASSVHVAGYIEFCVRPFTVATMWSVVERVTVSNCEIRHGRTGDALL
ncbi:Inositol-phosphate phosphatase [Sesbania bispinosa]|nr:Inositol-phosphate phosphatase [Sesbania bispinosa]